MHIADYTIQQTLHQGRRFLVYRALKQDEKISRILKVWHPSRQEIPGRDASEYEYRLVSRIVSEYVINACDHFREHDASVLVLEDIDGQPLNAFFLREHPYSLERLLELARRIAKGLAAIHQQNIIHKDINPSNIIWNPETGQLKIIDFDIAAPYTYKSSYAGDLERLEGTLPYISPEQTGRINRTVDQRSDLYSLGATLYELFTGHLPFESPDPLELVYAHLARFPQPPHTINSQIPESLSQLVLKLLAKNPDERYQSAEGVLYDLEQMQANLSGLGDLTGFMLGTQDFSGKLHIPEKLYGREAEAEQLLNAYQRVRQGAKELILVSGYAGSGKTALVHEISTPITRDRGYFISGKFEQLQRVTPYFAFIQAFTRFCQLLLTEKEDVLAQWRAKILQALEGLGKVLTDMIPLLSKVIGTQPEVPEVGGQDTQRRLNFVFQRFLRAIASPDHPLVIFLDDLQWADPASLHLLQALREDTLSQSLLIIGAYRDNEVSRSHPLMALMQELQQTSGEIPVIAVHDLRRQHIGAWLSDTLKTGVPEDIADLTDLIVQKTGGNAFFTIQFLENLYRERLLYFDFQRGRWGYDIEEINAKNFTENVVDFLAHNIRTLPADTQEILTLASCIGNTFDLPTLVVISENSRQHCLQQIERTLSEHLVFPLGDDMYRFMHDRIQQAAYTLIPAEELPRLHLQIGRLLLNRLHKLNLTAMEADPYFFEIINHLNRGVALIEEKEERLTLTQLNLKAGQKAKISGAYQQSSVYLHSAIDLLAPDAWQQYTLTLAIYQEALQAAYLCGNYDEMERFVELVMQHAQQESDKMLAHEHVLMSLMAQNQVQQAVDRILDIFHGLGLDFPRTCGKSRLNDLLLSTISRLKAMGDEELRHLPPMIDARAKLAIHFYMHSSTILYFGSQSLSPYIALRMLNFTLQHGMTQETAYLFADYGVRNSVTGDLGEAARFGQLSLDILDRTEASAVIRARTCLFIGAYIACWKEPYQRMAALFLDGYHLAVQSGDFEYAGYLLTNHLLMDFLTDTPLETWRENVAEARQALTQLKQQIPLSWMDMTERFVNSLCQETFSRSDMFDASDRQPPNPGEAANPALFWTYYFRVFLALLFEIHEELDASIEGLKVCWEHQRGTIHFAEALVFSALGLIRIIDTQPLNPAQRQQHLKQVRKVLRHLKHWTQHGPINHQHRYALLQAELLRVTGGKFSHIRERYEEAIQAAQQHDFLAEEALADELTAKFYLEQEREQVAEFYLLKARQCYQQWGAVAKVKHLDEHYPKYLRRGVSTLSQDGTSRGTDSTSSLALDVNTLLKASQTLSGEVQLSGLLEKMLHILIENAGARRGVFLDVRGEQILIQADGSADGIKGVLQAAPMEEAGNVPLSVINYVARSKQPVVFDHLAKETAYAHDPYIHQQQPVSVVCFPVLKQGELAAILYLENDLVEGAFTPARLEILNLLSAQIAISVENAELYEHLEEKVRQRTSELREAHAALAESHKAITDSVDYASRIQKAVLPADDLLTDLLPEHFILFQPRSVVSGDFYWVRQIEERLIVTVADCTGHGVPGALVSMLGMAFLNELVPQLAAQGRLQAGTLLDALREKVKTAFKQEGRLMEQKDGMDIALCIFEPGNARLQFAGAYHPLYLIRDGMVHEIKADRMPIGVHRREQPFSTHDVDLHPGDRLYLFSDGYADQDGGPERTGFSKARFQELLLEIHQDPLERQKELLLQRFSAWKGDLPQRDDVLVFGLRV